MLKIFQAPVLVLTMGCVCVHQTASAQSTAGFGNAAIMWGTSSSGAGGSGADSSLSHATNGLSGGQVNAAKNGLLYPSNIAIYSIGVQNITSVVGNGNNVTTSQTGTNSGTVATNGKVGGP